MRRYHVVRDTKTIHGWPYIMKGPRCLSVHDNRQRAKKRRG